MSVQIYINLFTIVDGSIKILTKKNKLLHTSIINNNIDETINNLVNINNKQISEVFDTDGVIKISYISVIDSSKINLDDNWININNSSNILEDKKILDSAIKTLRNKLINTEDLKIIFPLEFTLPEIQKVYEELLSINIDRRNFRKKFIKLDLIEDTNKISEKTTGRPAKLYRFKDNIKNKNLF